MKVEEAIVEQIRQQAVQLSTSEDLDVLVEAIGDKKYVLLGEATHGTSEFYKLRMELSRKLIERKVFLLLLSRATGRHVMR